MVLPSRIELLFPDYETGVIPVDQRSEHGRRVSCPLHTATEAAGEESNLHFHPHMVPDSGIEPLLSVCKTDALAVTPIGHGSATGSRTPVHGLKVRLPDR
jgi:hypothetical protein